jgi:hypothetical protein
MTTISDTSPSAVPTDSTNDYRAPIPQPCYACKGPAHGHVGHTILCLQVTLKAERERVRELEFALGAISQASSLERVRELVCVAMGGA